MADPVKLGPVHHIAFTVRDLARSSEFYRRVFAFQPVLEMPGLSILSDGTNLLALRDHGGTGGGDPFDERRVGLDHISFTVPDRGALEAAGRALDALGVAHGEIEDQGAALRLYVMVIRDPDNIQLELTAAYS